MASKIKRFSENIIWDDRKGMGLSYMGYSWERAETEVLKQFDAWRNKEKPRILSVSFGRCVENKSLDLEESPRYFFLRILYDDGNTSKIKRAEEK